MVCFLTYVIHSLPECRDSSCHAPSSGGFISRLWGRCVLSSATFIFIFILSLFSGIASDETADIPSALPAPFEVLTEVHPGIWVGSEPDSKSHFNTLRSLGIQAIISVDGATPRNNLAAENDITYFHVPIGYNEVPVGDQMAMYRAVSSVEGPVFIHCHHGRHRAPAAAACLLVASEKISPVSGLQILTRAGTSSEYTGLYESVKSAQPIDPEALGEIPVPPPMADAGDAAHQMATIDRIWDSLKALQKNNWQPLAAHPDQTASHQSLLLLESLNEYHRFLGNKFNPGGEEGIILGLAEKAGISAHLLHNSLSESDRVKADIHMNLLRNDCSNCHKRFRNSSN